MPSNRPVILLRLEQSLYDKVIAQAKARGHSRSGFVEILVRKALDLKAKRA